MTDPNKEPEPQKPDVSQALIDELNKPMDGGVFKTSFQSALYPILAVFSGLVIGGIFIALTTEEVYAAFRESFLAGLGESWRTVAVAYQALFVGAIGSPSEIWSAITSGDWAVFVKSIDPFLESLVTSTPLIFAGLGVALGFRTGLFNIGAEGQLFIGATTATWVGYTFTGLPAIIHIPLALLAGFIGGGLWGYIPGWLKAKTGGHEVINTIMMNFIAIRLVEWLLRTVMKEPESQNPISPIIADSAMLPSFSVGRFHIGFFIALVFAWITWWYLFRTKWGFTLRTVGANPNAARYSGMNIVRATVTAMFLSGGLAGLAGANEILGLNHRLVASFTSGIGFDSIALALLGKNHPVGVVLAAILFGTLRNGATQMQLDAGIPIDIISIVQALVLAFIAAPAIVRTIYRLRDTGDDGQLVTNSWG
ncbi:MAG: ABC transporter permease [Anaerolineae bacterium]